MIPIQWTSRSEQKNLPDLLQKLENQGGRIVEYRSVLSAFLFSKMSTRLFWVPEGKSRNLKGLLVSIPTLILGWWSLQGLFWTLGVILGNLMGGIDVTELFTNPRQNGELNAEMLEKIERQRKIQQWSFALLLLLLLALAFIFCVLPYM